MRKKTMALLALSSLAVASVFAQTPIWTTDTAAAYRSPYNAGRTRRVINALASEVMLRLAYSELTDSSLGKMTSLPGVENVTSLQKKMPDGSTRVLEFGVGTAADGSQTIEIYGASVVGATTGRNPDRVKASTR